MKTSALSLATALDGHGRREWHHDMEPFTALELWPGVLEVGLLEKLWQRERNIHEETPGQSWTACSMSSTVLSHG